MALNLGCRGQMVRCAIIRCIKMMESVRIYQVVRIGNEYDLRPVDAVPADSVCTLYIGGNGITNENRVMRLGAIVDREILQDIGDNIPNYVVMYDALLVDDNRAERLIEMDKRNNDVLPRTGISAAVYLCKENLDVAYRRKVLPLLINNGARGVMRIQFAIDGDMDDIVSHLLFKVRNTMKVLGFSDQTILGALQMVLQNSHPYSDYITTYAQDIFEKTLLPRVSDGNGRRVDLDTALRRVREMNLLAQCHGGHVIRVIEQHMNDAMVKMGYSAQEIKQVMAQVFVTAFAPSCALGNSKFQFISFMSAYDQVVDVPNNWVYKYVTDNRIAEAARFSDGETDWQWKFAPIFLSGRNGNAFIVKQRFKYRNAVDGPNLIPSAEHNNAHYFPASVIENNRVVDVTEDGELLGLLARNIVTNGIKNSLRQRERFTPLPQISELVLDGKYDNALKELMTAMTSAGNVFMDNVSAYAREHNIEIHPPIDMAQYTKFSELKR